MASKQKFIELGKLKYPVDVLQGMTEEQAVKAYCNQTSSQVRNAWKQANGKTKRNHTEDKGEDNEGK